MNGLRDHVYSTIHVTPEPQCSYASFETNLSLPNYKGLISQVFELFQPGTVTLTLFNERASVPSKRSVDMDIPGYTLVYKTMSELGCNRDITLCTYESLDFRSQQRCSRTLMVQPMNEISM